MRRNNHKKQTQEQVAAAVISTGIVIAVAKLIAELINLIK